MEAEKIVKRSRRRQKVPVEESQLVKLKEEEIEEQDKIVKM